MNNIFWVIPARLAGRSGPDRDPWLLSELRAGGFDVIINLTEFEPDRREFTAEGLEVAWIPFPNIFPPDTATKQACLTSLPQAQAVLQAHLQAGRCVLVHCSWGRDRTGLLLAYHLALVDQLSASAAIARLRKVRPKAVTAPGWEPMATQVIDTLLAEYKMKSLDKGAADFRESV